MGDREIARESQSDQTQGEGDQFGPASYSRDRFAHLIFISAAAFLTAELVHTVVGFWPVNVHSAAVWKFADAIIAWVMGLVGLLRAAAIALRDEPDKVLGL